MADMAWPMLGRRQTLAQIMAEAGIAYGQRRALRCALIQHHQQMGAGVDFGVMQGGLRHAEQALELRRQARQRAAFAQQFDHSRRLGLHQALGDLLPDPFGH